MRVHDLTKSYGSKVVVDHVDIEFPEGKVTSLIGPNGAGKSTVMGMISRLSERDAGEIEFQGRDLREWKSKDLARHLAILTQTNNTNMKLTVRELVAMGRFPYSAGHLTEGDERKIDEALGFLALEDIQDTFIDELSGGQRQRAFIAMVIAQDTDYVLLDEPTNNLDITYASQLMHIVRSLADDLGKTVILVLHEINYAAFYSDYICALKDGRVHSFGTVQEVMRKDRLKDLYGVDFEIMQIEGKPLSLYW